MTGLRLGIVVDTHPEDNSVDLVMADDGSRLVGVQIVSLNGSTRTGSVDLPAVPPKADKWDVTSLTGQDMRAVVGFMGSHPVVLGLLYPQINKMLFEDKKLRFDRHQSDVMTSIDGDGNIQVVHPSGAFIRIGESPGLEDLSGKNVDGGLQADRNTERKVDIRVELAGNVVQLTMGKDGNVTFFMQQDLFIKAEGSIRISAEENMLLEAGYEMKLKAPRIDLN